LCIQPGLPDEMDQTLPVSLRSAVSTEQANVTAQDMTWQKTLSKRKQ